MIDFQIAYRNKIPNKSFEGGVLETPTGEDHMIYAYAARGLTLPLDEVEESAIMQKYWTAWLFDNPLLQPRLPGDLDLECYKLLPATVYGYALLNRKWCEFRDLRHVRNTSH